MSVDVLAAVKHTYDLYVLVLNDIENHILSHRKAAQAGAQIIACAAHARKLTEQVERSVIASTTLSAATVPPLSLKI
jgi:hypothetical protein